MDDIRNDELRHSAQARAHWVHDLRNAVGQAGLSAALARRMLARGDTDDATDLLERAERAFDQCRALLTDAAAATALEPASRFSGAETVRSSSRDNSHRPV